MSNFYPGIKSYFLFAVVIYSFDALSQRRNPDTFTAFFTHDEIVLDGALREKAWINAIHISNFYTGKIYRIGIYHALANESICYNFLKLRKKLGYSNRRFFYNRLNQRMI